MAVIRRGTVAPVTGSSGYPGPYNLGRGHLSWRPLSDAGGLTQIGAALETLEPGGTSSQRHWHEAEDEFLYVLEGELTVLENDGLHRLGPGDAAAWPAGEANAHQLRNETDRPVTYLIVGTRAPADVVHYADIDLVYRRDRAGDGYEHRDGTPYPPREKM